MEVIDFEEILKILLYIIGSLIYKPQWPMSDWHLCSKDI